MKLTKSLLLGSAAGLCAVAGAQAADLPARAAAPVEYVRVCTAYGAGFFYIPGTDTCIRISGRARGEYNYVSSRATTPQVPAGGANNLANGDLSSSRGLGRFAFDARTQTGYGTLRTFVRFDIMYNSGGYLNSGTFNRAGTAFVALGQDTNGRAQTAVLVDKAFIQFAGFTAGRASSFYDFYAHDLELIANSVGSDLQATNLLAYTFTFGEGWSATVSAEDPTLRRQPIFSNQVFGGVTTSVSAGSLQFANFGGTFTAPVAVTRDALGRPTTIVNYDVIQRDRMPDFVGALRYDAPWGAAQLSAAVHELSIGRAVNQQTVAYAADGTPTVGGLTGTTFAVRQPTTEYGYAIQGGLKFNLPQLAAGDVLWLQAAYSEGALSYMGLPMRLAGLYNGTNTYTRMNLSSNDAFINAAGKLSMTEAWSVQGAFLHYWSPEWRSAFYGSYSEIYFGKGARAGAEAATTTTFQGGTAFATQNAFNTVLRDYSVTTVGANLIWSPVRDLDIGVEGLYSRAELLNGRTGDLNKNGGNIGSTYNPVTGTTTLGTGVPAKLIKSDDVFMARLRVQRDF